MAGREGQGTAACSVLPCSGVTMLDQPPTLISIVKESMKIRRKLSGRGWNRMRHVPHTR